MAEYWQVDASVGRHTDRHTDRPSYLGPGCDEPFGAGSLEAGGAGLWFVGLVTATVWKLFEHTTFQPSTHHLTLPHPTATGSVTLTHPQTRNKQTKKLNISVWMDSDFDALKETNIPPPVKICTFKDLSKVKDTSTAWFLPVATPVQPSGGRSFCHHRDRWPVGAVIGHTARLTSLAHLTIDMSLHAPFFPLHTHLSTGTYTDIF